MKWRLVVTAMLLVSCGGEASGPRPQAGQIPVAIDAMNALFGGAPDLDYFEISADLTGVTLVLAETSMDSDSGQLKGAFATQYRWEDGSLDQVGDTVSAEGVVFRGSAVQIDPDVIFSGIEADLDDPLIVDLAVQGAGTDGGLVIDVSIENSKGGRLLVLVNPEGRVLGVQAA